MEDPTIFPEFLVLLRQYSVGICVLFGYLAWSNPLSDIDLDAGMLSSVQMVLLPNRYLCNLFRICDDTLLLHVLAYCKKRMWLKNP